MNVFWGASMSRTAEEEKLREAYEEFKEEAQEVNAEYEPETVKYRWVWKYHKSMEKPICKSSADKMFPTRIFKNKK